MEKIELNSTPPVLLVTIVTKDKTEDVCAIGHEYFCYEPYDYENQREEFFHDGWGLVIHNRLESTDYLLSRRFNCWTYGIKCLHPLLLKKVSLFGELPEELHDWGEPSPWDEKLSEDRHDWEKAIAWARS